MANALSPDRVIDDFQKRVSNLDGRFQELLDLVQLRKLALRDPSGNLPLQRAMAEDAAFRLGGEWELFQHRWHIAAISVKQSTFRKRIQKDLSVALEKGPIRSILESLPPDSLTVPSRFTAVQIEALVDSEGFNLSFHSGDVWARKADTDLEPEHAKLVKAIVADGATSSLVELVKAMRKRPGARQHE
jgi:hypothetical protein